MGKAARLKRERREQQVARLEEFDSHAGLRNGLRWIASEKREWAGIPMPLEGEQLVIEPTYPYAELGDFGKKPEPEEEDDDLKGAKIRNQFWSMEQRSWIVIIQKRDGTIDWGKRPGVNHIGYDLATLKCADAWGVEQESNAINLLGTLLSHRAFKQYLLTGMFLETSPRSGVSYMFRRLKPTIAITPRGRFKKAGDELMILCTLCLHPIAYYKGSWAGAMCPTDDVIAHLMLMRADEKMLWRRANQHPAYLPESGL